MSGPQPARSVAPIRGLEAQGRAARAAMDKLAMTMRRLEERMPRGNFEYFCAFTVKAEQHGVLHHYSSQGMQVRCFLNLRMRSGRSLHVYVHPILMQNWTLAVNAAVHAWAARAATLAPRHLQHGIARAWIANASLNMCASPPTVVRTAQALLLEAARHACERHPLGACRASQVTRTSTRATGGGCVARPTRVRGRMQHAVRGMGSSPSRAYPCPD